MFPQILPQLRLAQCTSNTSNTLHTVSFPVKWTAPRLPSRRNVSAGPGAIASNTFWSSVAHSIALKQARRVEYLGQRIHHATRLPALLGPFLTKTNTVGNRDEIKVTFSQNVIFVRSFWIVLDIFHKNRCLDSRHFFVLCFWAQRVTFQSFKMPGIVTFCQDSCCFCRVR